MENNNQPSTGLPISPEDAKRAAEALTAYLGEYIDSVTELVKLLYLNRAIAKKAVKYAEIHMKSSEISSFENAYNEYVTQLENVIKSTFNDVIVEINAYRLSEI